jgi:hypothetical protein
MATKIMKLLICDKCKKKEEVELDTTLEDEDSLNSFLDSVKNNFHYGKVDCKVVDDDSHQLTMDLCETCTKQLFNWLQVS